MKKTMNYRKFLMPVMLLVMVLGIVGIVSAQEYPVSSDGRFYANDIYMRPGGAHVPRSEWNEGTESGTVSDNGVETETSTSSDFESGSLSDGDSSSVSVSSESGDQGVESGTTTYVSEDGAIITHYADGSTNTYYAYGNSDESV